MHMYQMCLGVIATNVYFLVNDETNETVIVDPADQAEKIMDHIASKGLIPKAIYLTHGHFDHILACEDLKRANHIPVYAMEDEKETLANPGQNLTEWYSDVFTISMEADRWLKDGEYLDVAGLPCEVIATPGHTPGGCCYYFPEEKILVCGDTLFEGSYGRTDFPGGSFRKLHQSMLRLFTLPDDVIALPGHGSATTIGTEKKFNAINEEGSATWFD